MLLDLNALNHNRVTVDNNNNNNEVLRHLSTQLKFILQQEKHKSVQDYN